MKLLKATLAFALASAPVAAAEPIPLASFRVMGGVDLTGSIESIASFVRTTYGEPNTEYASDWRYCAGDCSFSHVAIQYGIFLDGTEIKDFEIMVDPGQAKFYTNPGHPPRREGLEFLRAIGQSDERTELMSLTSLSQLIALVGSEPTCRSTSPFRDHCSWSVRLDDRRVLSITVNTTISSWAGYNGEALTRMLVRVTQMKN